MSESRYHITIAFGKARAFAVYPFSDSGTALSSVVFCEMGLKMGGDGAERYEITVRYGDWTEFYVALGYRQMTGIIPFLNNAMDEVEAGR